MKSFLCECSLSLGPVYPEGPWRPESGVQRGTIWNGNGDPTTPGYPSVDEAPRMTDEQMHLPEYSYGTPLSNIPSMPLSYGDAGPLLAALHGHNIKDGSWQVQVMGMRTS